MKVRVNQVRAARALLDWSQKDLAERADMSEVSITNFEKEKSTPNQSTVEKILNAFSLAGVSFIDKGVTLKEDTITTMEGEGWYLRLLDDVYYTLIDKPDAEYLTMCADDSVSTSEINGRLRKIRNAGIRMRQLVEEGNTYLMGPLKEYRYIPKENFRNHVSLIYGDKIAICTEGNAKAVVFRDANLADTWRNIFDVMWSKLDQPKESAAHERF